MLNTKTGRELRPLHNDVRKALGQHATHRLQAAVILASLAGIPAAGAAVFPAEIDLFGFLAQNDPDGRTGFMLNGNGSLHYAGNSVSKVGDINADGFDDVIIGATGGAPDGRLSAGESFVIFGTGTGFAPELELASLRAEQGGDGSKGFVLNGIDNGDTSGRSVSAAGDLNSDGIDDLIVGAHSADPGGRSGAGESYVVFGTAQGFSAEFELSSMLAANGGNGTAGFVLNGVNQNDRSGSAVSAAGDVNGDGIDDLIIGAYAAGSPRTGECYVVFGTDQGFAAEFELASLLAEFGGDGSAGFVLRGIDSGDLSGRSVSAAGDVNGDGIDDVIVGADYAAPGGESYVVFGTNQGFGAEFELASLKAANGGDGSTGFILNGASSNGRSGRSVSAAGDINADGLDDLIVGAHKASPYYDFALQDRGQSYVVFGTDQGFSAELDLRSLSALEGGDGSIGFIINGVRKDDRAGFAVSGTGDVNGDAIDDLIISATYADPNNRTSAGAGYVVFGKTAGFAAEVELSALLPENGGDGSTGFTLSGPSILYRIGTAAGAAGDVNNDGINDLIIATNAGAGSEGASFVIFGRQDTDGDGVADAFDNCLTVANSDQHNAGQADGIGNRCDPDVSNDCVVNFVDLASMKTAFFNPNYTDHDFNNDQQVNFLDLGIMKEYFFAAPGPSGLPNQCEAENNAQKSLVDST